MSENCPLKLQAENGTSPGMLLFFCVCVCVCVYISEQIPIKDPAKRSRVAETVNVVLTAEAG